MHFDRKTLRNIFFGVGGCIILYWVLHEPDRVDNVLSVLGKVFSPFIFGAGLAFVINVPMRGIENRFGKIRNGLLRRTVALIITMILILLILALVFYLLIPQLITTGTNFVERLPGFAADVETWVTNFLHDHPQLMEWVSNNVDWQNFNFSSVIQTVIDFASNGVSTIISGAVTAISDIVGTLMNAVIGIVFGVYCLFNKEGLARQGRKLAYAFLPERWADNVVRIMRMTNTAFSNFLSGQCIEVCILGSMFAISMAIFDMPYIPLVSVLVAVTAFIPVVGAFIGCIFGALFILVDNPTQAFGFVLMFLVLQQIEGNLIYPRVVGSSIGLPGMWVLLAVAVGGELMGVAGMFLMIPMASVIYTLCREFTARRLAVMNIDKNKLQVQPPELRYRLKKHVEKIKEKKKNKKENIVNK